MSENTANQQPLVDADAWVRGETEELVLSIVDEASQPLDLSLMTLIALTVRKSPGAADPPLLQLTVAPASSFTGDGLVVRAQTGQNVGVVDVLVSSTRTTALPAGDYWYDVEVTKPDGKQKIAIWASPLQVLDSVYEAA